MKKMWILFVMGTLACLLASCSTIGDSFEAEDPNKDRFNSTSGDDRGGAQFETAIWSSDPNKKTLPEAIGADGKDK